VEFRLKSCVAGPCGVGAFGAFCAPDLLNGRKKKFPILVNMLPDPLLVSALWAPSFKFAASIV
jgi:hypothetical protein